MHRKVFFVLLLSLLCTAAAQPGRPLRALVWNVENLFDTVHDEGFLDEEFLPAGERRWTSHRYWQKLDEVAKVVAAIGEDGSVPDLIGLCEVENDSVLTTLTRRSLLRHLGYDYVITHSQDQRGVDVALLYQPVRFRLLDSRAVRVPSREHGLRPTRDLLYVRGLVATTVSLDTLHVIVVHLPSRAGGKEGDQNRKLAANTLWHFVDSLLAVPSSPTSPPRLLVMGDFNATRRDPLFRHTPLRLTDDAQSPGTYNYRGYWQWIDHLLVSTSIQTPAPARPIRLPWLLEGNKTYGGDMPRRTYRGPTYHGGISDHLPVLLDLHL